MISGNTVNLRAIEKEDVEKYHLWINDDETNQWRGLYHPTSKEKSQEWIETQRITKPDSISLAIEDKNKTTIGFIGLQGICGRSRRAEIWIYIGDKSYWGKGFGKSSIHSLCNYAFEQMNLHRIWLECNPEFENVVKCYEQIGFKNEGTLREAYYRHGAFRDTCIMGLLRSEFIANGEQSKE